jgi:adenylate cyclase
MADGSPTWWERYQIPSLLFGALILGLIARLVIIGDSLVALFGLPLAGDDDRERAAACAIAMQLEMDEVNARNQRAKLPDLSIGVGVACGEVLVVGLGAGDQVKYKAVGEPLVVAARIEAHARSGEVWICDETRGALGDLANVDAEDELQGATEADPLRVHRLLGVSGSSLISLRALPSD